MISGCLSSVVRIVHTAALATSRLFAPGLLSYLPLSWLLMQSRRRRKTAEAV